MNLANIDKLLQLYKYINRMPYLFLHDIKFNTLG